MVKDSINHTHVRKERVLRHSKLVNTRRAPKESMEASNTFSHILPYPSLSYPLKLQSFIISQYSSKQLSKYHGSSASKESICNSGDPGSISGLGRFPGEGIGYPLWYSWASAQMAQMVKNPHATYETWVQSLSLEDPLEEGVATHFSLLAWRIPMDSGAQQPPGHGIAKSQTRLSD